MEERSLASLTFVYRTRNLAGKQELASKRASEDMPSGGRLVMENIVSKKRGLSDSPLVSVISTVLNGAKYLEGCIQSVLAQSYPRIEHIFVDGVSTDGTVEILRRYQTEFPDRIRFISEPDEGPGIAWNKGLKMARGEILNWLGSDDKSEPGAVQCVIEFFKANPDAYFVFGSCDVINGKGELIGKVGTTDFSLKQMINDSNCIPCPSAFYRREAIDTTGWFNRLGNDRDYWIRVAKVFPIHRIDRVLSSFRIHELSSTTGSSRNARKMWARQDYLVTRRYGGSILAPYCRRYYTLLIIEGLRPLLGFSYPFMKKVLKQRRIRSSSSG